MLRGLLSEAIDYAGLFPPAALNMAAAVENYAAYRESEHAWMLGRFVVPVTRLEEFQHTAVPYARGKEPWRLSALGSGDFAADSSKITEFNNEFGGRFCIDTVETKASHKYDLDRAVAAFAGRVVPYFELAINSDLEELIAHVSSLKARAKVRTGGVTADAFPSSGDLARFITTCTVVGTPFKATAGLHHPLRSLKPLTYAPSSPTAVMHGFLNVFLAASFAHAGLNAGTVSQLLEERSVDAFCLDHGVSWRGNVLSAQELRDCRNLTSIAFGSCSFQEPVDELRALGLL
jgi:hypothetical protein